MFNISDTTAAWAKQENVSHTVLETTESTNTFAKENLKKETNLPHLVIANEQTKGRGRGTNEWISPGEGQGFLCSLIFKLEGAPQPIAAPCFGWAIHRALSETFDLDFSVKAPNDIYIEDKKLGGILLESVSQGDDHYLILGIGLNVFSHPEIKNSGSLINFTTDREIEENQWEQFLSHLVSLSSQAAIACQSTVISDVIIGELDTALKKYNKNEITELLNDGGLRLIDGSITNWREL